MLLQRLGRVDHDGGPGDPDSNPDADGAADGDADAGLGLLTFRNLRPRAAGRSPGVSRVAPSAGG